MSGATQTHGCLPLPLRTKPLSLDSQMSATMEQKWGFFLPVLTVEIAAVLVCISVAEINIMTKATWEIKGLF